MNQLSQLLDQAGGVNSASSGLENCEPQTTNSELNPDLLEHARLMSQDSPDVFLKAAINIASVDLFTVLNRFDTVTLSQRLEEKPELYFQLVNSQVNLMKASLEREKLEFKQKQAEARQRDCDQKLRARKPILLTTQSLDRFGQVLTRSRRDEEADPLPPASPAPNLGLHTQDPCSSTANTGGSDTFEFAAPLPEDLEMRVAVPDTKTQDDHDDACHEWREEYPADLVCYPA